jgi:Signal peptidase, peptidase S26
MNETTRSPFIAFVLGVIAPGLGLAFSGRGLAALLVAVLWIGGGVGVASLVMSTEPTLFARAHLLFAAFSHLGSAVASALIARRPSPKKGYEHWWWVFGFGMLTWAANGQVRERVVSKQIGFALRMFDESMEPGFAVGDMLVANAQKAPNPGDVVLVQGLGLEGAPALARVIARQGQVVRIDNSRLSLDDTPVPESACRAEEIQAPGLACAAQTVGGTRFVFGGEGCTVPVTSVPAGQLFVAPDARTKEQCARLARLVQKTDVLGVVFRAR